jgi:hypothetical protein
MKRTIAALLLLVCLMTPGCLTVALADALGGPPDAPRATASPRLITFALLLPLTLAVDLALSPLEVSWWLHEELCAACDEREEEREDERERRAEEEELREREGEPDVLVLEGR